MSEEQPDFRFSSELSYLGMLDEFRNGNIAQNDRVESFGSNIWFPDISSSFPNFGNSEFSRKDAKDGALYINEDCPEVQVWTRGTISDMRIVLDEVNLMDEFPELVCKYTLAFENICTRLNTKPGVISFNLGITWMTPDQVDLIQQKLEEQIEFPVHP